MQIQTPQITLDDLKLARDVLIAFATLLVTVVGFLVRLAFKMGRDAEKVRLAMEAIVPIQQAIQAIPLLQQRLGTAEESWARTRSDIKHLLRGSRPDYNGTGGTNPPPAPQGG